MEQVKLFWDKNYHDLEKGVNEWLSENRERITIVDRKFTASSAWLSIAIFYIPTH